MRIQDRDEAVRAIAVCDQIESALRDGRPEMIAASRHFLKKWAEDIDEARMLTWCQCIRARAEEILRGDHGGEELTG